MHSRKSGWGRMPQVRLLRTGLPVVTLFFHHSHPAGILIPLKSRKSERRLAVGSRLARPEDSRQ